MVFFQKYLTDVGSLILKADKTAKAIERKALLKIIDGYLPGINDRFAVKNIEKKKIKGISIQRRLNLSK
jgi:hypothetical protein